MSLSKEGARGKQLIWLTYKPNVNLRAHDKGTEMLTCLESTV